ncbi:alpha/beta hydrolase family protein [Iningainema tapete]|uniref:Alpha/beta hydrolase n=1 Tax=Iningainema tapete BLCC-T55 TaxID=2748662 RepID=A0A8J6XQC6_9CYAN|nr:alpha/beta hydrolase [Iningainema tapete]MBD2776284.1 alpha/beta hydrolase [Iningainema tapete BLCC-T55]
MLSLKALSVVCTSTSLLVFGVNEIADASSFNPTPIFDNIASYTTTITGDNNLADIYYPNPTDLKTSNYSFPVALLLQGGLVDKSNYSNYAQQVASYGFVVVVPNSKRTVPTFGEALSPQTRQIDTALQQIVIENNNTSSPLVGKLDTEKVGLLGHSLGSAVGLSAIGNLCVTPTLCSGSFSRPKQILAGAFFGANLRDENDVYLPIKNDGIPVALLQGDLDGRALPIRASLTYDQIKSPPAALINITGANHFSITNTNNPAGAIPDPIDATLNQDVAIETIARWSGLFLRASILNDQDAFNYVYFTGDAADSNVIVESKRVSESASIAPLGILFAYFTITQLLKRIDTLQDG